MPNTKEPSQAAYGEKFANVYYMKLLMKDALPLRRSEIKAKLDQRFHAVDVVMEDATLSAYALREYMVTYQDDQQMPAQLLITQPQPFQRASIPDMVVQQCWNCEDVEGLLKDCHYELMISDFLAAGLPLHQRCELLAAFMDIVLEVYPETLALYFPHALKLLPVSAWKESDWPDPALHFLDGGVNVRFFQIQDKLEYIIDTTGLTALGLCDIQCHFHDLDIDFMIRYMFNFVAYVYHNGDIIRDGETMDGRTPQERWLCQHEDALVPPKRVVLDVNCLSFAAGKRS